MNRNHLVIIAIILGLAGCKTENTNATSSSNVYSMTPVSEGIQTFASVNSTERNATRSNSEHGYVFMSLSGATQKIDFYKTGNDGQTKEPITAPKILNIRDINQNYAAINIENIDVSIADKSYSGTFTLIYDKHSGDLFPLTENGKPIYYQVDAEHEYWYTDTRFSNVADSSKIYFRHTENKSLHFAELKDNAFQTTKIFDDYFGEFVVGKDGIIVRKNWSGGDYIWVSPDSLEQETLTASANISPFLIDGKLYGYDNSDKKIYTLEKEGLSLELTESDWTTQSYSVTNNSVKRGNFEMKYNCAVYEFNHELKTITEVHSRSENAAGRFAAAAGTDTLFCLYGANSDEDTPKFKAFDISKAQLTDFNATVGTHLNAAERLTVVSDKELMFYDNNAGTIKEFYIQLDGTETQKENTTGNVDVIRHLNK